MRVMCRGKALLTFNVSTKLKDFAFQAIEGALRDQEGIHSIKVALLAERATVEYDPAVWNVDKLVNVSSSAFLTLLCLNLNATHPMNRKFLIPVSMRHSYHLQEPT